MHSHETDRTRRSVLTAAALAGLGAAWPAAAGQAPELSAHEESNVAVVNAFCAAWKTGDAQQVATHLAEDCTVRFLASRQNSPVVAGRADVVEQVRTYMHGSQIEFIVQDTYAAGPIVVNRRVDRIVSQNGSRDFHIVGVFFLTQGAIKEWHDFDANA